jgi:hypothetical protein
MPQSAVKGVAVNAAGTKIATAVALGSAKLDTTKPALDHSTLVTHGSQKITVKSAINMGLLARDSADALVELNAATAATKVTK